MKERDFRDLPQWHWQELPVAETNSDAFWRIALLLVLALILSVSGALKLRRHVIA